MNNDKEKEKILRKAVQLITSEISIKIYTQKIYPTSHNITKNGF